MKVCFKLGLTIVVLALVALVPVSAFGQYDQRYVRLSYANSYQNIEKAMERIVNALRELPPEKWVPV